MKKPLVILTGPTAVGKTNTSLLLAKEIGGEIISADSMQVYRHMNIGSAKIKPEEMNGIPHHLIDILEPEEEFHVARFKALADRAMHEIWERNHIPIVTGGTGFYIQALLYDIDFSKGDEDFAYRKELSAIAEKQGAAVLHTMLCKVDAASAIDIHPNNVKRVIRALEYFHQTGEPISKHNETERQKVSPYNFAYFVLTDTRELLYANIDKRVDCMLLAGLVEEVALLRDKGYTNNMVSMQGLGYKEIFAYLNGEMTLEEAVYVLKRDTRHFAKRQLTWFKRERDVIWLPKGEYGRNEIRLAAEIKRILTEREIV